jgi:murein L,D-transpeptidase YafK
MWLLCAATAYAQPQVAARILITKADRTLYIFDSEGNIIKDFKVALGPNPVGHKREQGDGRTPEGRYFIDMRNQNSEYFLSLKLSYPSPKDKEKAKKMGVKPGGDIFIHGQPNGRDWQTWKYGNKHDWTQGCIGLLDQDMSEIWNMVPDGTPVVIVP